MCQNDIFMITPFDHKYQNSSGFACLVLLPHDVSIPSALAIVSSITMSIRQWCKYFLFNIFRFFKLSWFYCKSYVIQPMAAMFLINKPSIYLSRAIVIFTPLGIQNWNKTRKTNCDLWSNDAIVKVAYGWFSPDVTAAVLVHRTIEKKSFGNLTLL